MKLYGLKLPEQREQIVEKKGAVGPLIDDLRIYRSLREILEVGKVKVSQPYKQSLWVYACISAIVQNLCRIPFVLKRDAGTLEPNIVDSGPFYDLFQNPNPYMTTRTLLEATLTYFCLRGEAIWIKEGQSDITKLPREIYCFDPIRFEPVYDPNTGWMVGWEYKGKTTTFFSVNEVLHFKMFNPYNDIRGLSPIEAMRMSIEQDYHTSVFNNAFFKNGARVSGFLSAEGELTEEQFNRIVRQFEDRHAGSDKAHKIAVVEGGATFTEAKITQQEMEFIGGKKLTRLEILAGYKVNEVVLGIYDSIKSYLGIQSAHKAFWEECLIPKITYFEETLWALFFSKVGVRRGKGRIWAEWDTANVGPLQSNYNDKIITASKMFMMGWPINDINKRLQLGMKEVPWGDQWWVPGGYLPVTQILGQGDKPSKTKPDTVSDKPKEPKKEEISYFQSPHVIELESKLKKFIFEQRKRTLAEIGGGKIWDNINNEKDYDRLKVSLSGIYSQTIYSGIFHARRELNDLVPMNEHSVDIAIYVENRSNFIVNSFRGVSEEIISILKTSEESNDDLGSKVRGVYNMLTSRSSEMARIEVEMANQFGRSLLFKEAKKEFSSTLQIKYQE